MWFPSIVLSPDRRVVENIQEWFENFTTENLNQGAYINQFLIQLVYVDLKFCIFNKILSSENANSPWHFVFSLLMARIITYYPPIAIYEASSVPLPLQTLW